MPDLAMQIRYMAAHVRLHAKVNPREWSLQELADTALLLPPPEISFEEWSKGAPAGQSSPAPNPVSVPITEEDVARANRNAIASLKGEYGEKSNVVKFG